MANPCWDSIKDVASDILGYIESKTGVKYDPNPETNPTGKGRDEYLAALKELKQESVKDLSSIHDQIKGKNPPPKTPEQSEVNTELADSNLVGIHHEALKKVADKIGLEQPERGTFLSPEEQTQRGRLLLQGGANPEQVAADFKSDGKVNADIISVARAHFENLTKIAQKAIDTFGKNSKEFNDAKLKMQQWQDEVVKPMGTVSGGAMSSLQGEADLDTGSFVATQMAVEQKTGKATTPQQEKQIRELTGKVSELNKALEDLHKQFAENIDKNINEEGYSKNRGKAKKIIEGNKKIKDEDADLIFQSAKRDYVAARVAKAIDKGVSIEKAVDDLAKEGVIKPENIDKAKEYFNALVGEETNPMTAEEKNIKRLEKQLEDLKAGIKKTKPEEREKSQKEIDLENEIKTEKDKQLITRFADKRDNNFTPEEVKDIWEYAKREYIDKGRNMNEIIRGVSMDLGLTSKQVLTALEQPKGSKIISDKMYRMQNRRSEVQNKVKEYVTTINRPKLVKWLNAVPNFFFQKAIFGHGTVGMITHAGMNIFRPTIAKIYWPLFFKQFKNSFGALTDKGLSDYEKSMEHLRNNPLFTIAKRSGVKVDPSQINDDYAIVKKWLGKIGMMGDRGFNTLKEFRMAMFENEYNRLSNIEKSDQGTLKEIAKIVNHATGTSNFKPGSVLNTAVFAPRLEASKWARIVTDPAKAIITFGRWNNSTIGQKAAAKIVARKAGELIATYLGGLAINQALLYASGSNQSINFTDPTKKDWLKFKEGDNVIDLSGGIVPTMQFIGHLLYIPFETRQELGTKEHRNRIEAFGKTSLDYAFSKASPFGSTVKDVATAHDFMGNTMPWSEDKPKHKYAHKLTWKEYLFTEQAPIPAAEAGREIYKSMQDKGMSEPQIDGVLTGLLMGAITGGTGAKVREDYSNEKGEGGGGGATGGFHRIKQPKQISQPKQR